MRTIEIEQLGKRYRLGQENYVTLKDTLSAAVRRRHTDERARSDLWALRDVSFAVDEGEVVGVIGRNGAGKSTLLKILARITEPTEGVARMRGKVGALLEVGTGFHPELTGRENIFLNGAILGMTRGEIRRRFDEIVSFAGVERFLETPVKRYSSGMYLRLAFSVAAHFEPDIVVVDEVLAVGDAEFQRRCLGKMSQFAREGRTVLFVSHDLGAVAGLCPRAIWIEGGVVKHDGPAGRSIELYLDARAVRASHVEFPPDADAAVQLVAVGVTEPSGASLEAARRDKPFAVRTRFLIRERIPGLDLKVYIVTRRGIRVLEENLSDWQPDAASGTDAGEWQASVVIPPVLPAGDYVLGIAMESPYQRFFDREVLTFSLWPAADERRDSVDRARLVQPGVEWRLEPTASASTGEP
jgi:ABC-2 type transport system ATP-binding protein/lipopolysaccharide transport system ATP-binding protein